VSSKPGNAAIYALRVVQLFAIALGFHYFLGAIGNFATGKLLSQILGFVLSFLVLLASSLTLVFLRDKYPNTTRRALKSADRRFDTELGPRTQTILRVIVVGFLVLVIGYMMVCMFWNPPWLP
jgi:hypothetical protein